MKKIILPFLSFIAFSCGGNNTADISVSEVSESTLSATETPAADTAAITALTEQQKMELDATTGATSSSLQATFNGVLMVPSKSHATVTLTMDGTVKNTALLPGEYIQTGEVIATIENPSFIDLQQTYLDASAQSEFLKQEYERQQTLSAQEAASQKKFQQSKADYLSMKSKMEAAAAQLSLLGVSAKELTEKGITPYIEIKAPISGYITDMKMNRGKHFMAGEPLCEMIDKNNMLLRLTAYEKDLDKFQSGDAVEFRVNGMGTTTFNAVIVSVGQQVDNTNRSIDVYAKISGSNNRFRPGMYITARIVTK